MAKNEMDKQTNNSTHMTRKTKLSNTTKHKVNVCDAHIYGTI